jgi:hypothetical protein
MSFVELLPAALSVMYWYQNGRERIERKRIERERE